MNRKNILFLIAILFTIQASAQLYTYASATLPSNGATGQSMDVQAADLDGDGDLDLVLANEFQRNTVLTNDGQGVFTNNFSIPNAIHDSEDVAIADYDSDGDLDLIFCSEDDFIHEYYLNDGNGNFSLHPSFQFPNSTANAVITADLNNDSFPDVLFGNAGQNQVFINTGMGTFTDETNERLPTESHTTQDLHLSDVDNDGHLDLLAGNEGSSKIYINDGQGFFTDETADRLPIHANVETRKISSGDINGDNAPDLFFSNVAFLAQSALFRSNILFLNDGNGYFTDVSDTQLPTDNDDTLDAVFEDVDTDGDLDLVIANVNLNGVANQQVFLNNSDGVFEDKTEEVLGGIYFENALGVIAADLNGDGGKDLYFCERNINSAVKDLFFIKNLENSIPQEIDPFEKAISIVPNPVKNSFTINSTLPLDGNWTAALLDSNGLYLFPLEFEAQEINHLYVKLPQKQLTNGTYLLRLKNKKRIIVKRITVLR